MVRLSGRCRHNRGLSVTQIHWVSTLLHQVHLLLYIINTNNLLHILNLSLRHLISNLSKE